MPNYVTIRVGLCGPRSEIERFIATCIRIPRDDTEISFDFEALIPMPDAIFRTFEHKDEQTKKEALLATGFDDWYEWSIENWGVKWNATSFHEFAREPECYDFLIDTAWSYPEPVFRALAAQFPNLRGNIFAIESMADWAYVDTIADGHRVGSRTSISHKLEHVIYSANVRSCAPTRHSVEVPYRAEDIVASVWSASHADLPPSHFALINLAFAGHALLTFLERYDDEVLEPSDLRHRMASYVSSSSNLEFFLEELRYKTRADRKLIDMIVSAVRASRGDPDGSQSALASLLASTADEWDTDELSEWASVAMYRNGRALTSGCHQDLVESISRYGQQLLALMLAEISKGALTSASDKRHAA